MKRSFCTSLGKVIRLYFFSQTVSIQLGAFICLYFFSVVMFPQRKYIPDEYREKCDFLSWEGVKVVPSLAEERGVLTTKTFSRGSFICNYGGLNSLC